MDPQLPSLPPHVAAARDAEQLRMLAVGHFVLAGLALLGLAFIGFHYAVMHTVFDHPDVWRNAKGGPPPALMLDLFRMMYVAFAAFFIACGVGNLMSGLFLRQRRRRTFSLVMAGINCMNMPLGTVLGVFTFIVLLRESVRQAYAAREHANAR